MTSVSCASSAPDARRSREEGTHVDSSRVRHDSSTFTVCIARLARNALRAPNLHYSGAESHGMAVHVATCDGAHRIEASASVGSLPPPAPPPTDAPSLSRGLLVAC